MAQGSDHKATPGQKLSGVVMLTPGTRGAVGYDDQRMLISFRSGAKCNVKFPRPFSELSFRS
jgi:hypothetical protein